MPREKETIREEYEKLFLRLKKNHDQIAPKDRMKGGKYAKAYHELEEKVCKMTGSFCLYAVIEYVLIPPEPEYRMLLNQLVCDLKANQPIIQGYVSDLDLDGLNGFLSTLREQWLQKYFACNLNELKKHAANRG